MKKSNLESAWDFNRKKELNIAGCRFWTNKRTPANLFVHQGWSKEREHIKKTYTEIHTCSNSCNIKTWWTGIYLKSLFLRKKSSVSGAFKNAFVVDILTFFWYTSQWRYIYQGVECATYLLLGVLLRFYWDYIEYTTQINNPLSLYTNYKENKRKGNWKKKKRNVYMVIE